MSRENLHESIIGLQKNSMHHINCKDMFDSGMDLEIFWCRITLSYIQLLEIALHSQNGEID